MPHTTDLQMAPHHAIYIRTEEVRAVTCVMCKKTTEFKERQKHVEGVLRSHGKA